MEETTENLLNELLKIAEHHARKILLEIKMRALAPTWVAITRAGDVMITETPWEDLTEKEIYGEIIRESMRAREVVAYSFVTEAWAATLEPDEFDRETNRPKGGMTAGKHPARQEVVIACACTKEAFKWKQWRMVREATTERLVDLQEKPFAESAYDPESWLTKMLR